MTIPTTEIFGVRISRLGMKETVEYIADAIHSGRSLHVITANPIMFMHALEHPEFHQVMREADLNVPDGAGLVWAASYLGEGVAERVAGYDLMHELLKTGQNYGWSVFLLGAAADVVETAADNIARQYPRIRIAGWHHGYFKEEDDERIVKMVQQAAPDLLFVARSLDTQERWIARYRDQLGARLMMGVGGSFDVVSGKLKRAPLFMQRLGLEWLYRLWQEPSRIGRMLALPRFVLRVRQEKKRMQKIH